MNDALDLGIDGETYGFGWTADGSYNYSPNIILGINTNQKYSKFQARVGVADTSGNTSGKLLILADDKVVFTANVALKKSYALDLNIKGVQRLEIKRLPTQSGDITYAIGDPVLVP